MTSKEFSPHDAHINVLVHVGSKTRIYILCIRGIL